MIEDKNSIIKNAKYILKRNTEIVKDNSELFDYCKDLYDLWIDNHEDRRAGLFISDNYVGVNLNIYLGPDDNIEKDVNLFLDNIGIELIETDEYPDSSWIRYHFRDGNADLHVLAHYEDAKSCKVIESGEFRPILKRVCL